ncbi:platelet endothelial cell adhesion molecule isoform X1 [Micropterus salmoides]|uniref:platelet endothelial cell adhesion molecule isoform X1 n=1 Tax=Micropterus salmoides TaxID=27706 RepID=UPI0018EAE605|nr:platelet endothelial cell adhesion molecule isoform X1 [Micropterus salmoides]
MDSRPPNLLLLLNSLLQFFQCASGQSLYIIDTVGLTILPSSTVQSGALVNIRCRVSVSHDNTPHLTHTFQLTRDEVLIHSSTTAEDSVLYELSPARAADSGSYECRVTVKDKSKVSLSQKLDVTGLQTPILYLSKTKPYQNEEFKATCSAPEEKGSLIFRFYQRFRAGDSEKIKQPAPTGNSSETTLVLRHIGDIFLYCDYEINLVSGTRHSNHSNEIEVIVKELHITPVMNVLPFSNVFEGDIVEVVCKVVNPPKNIYVFLTRDRRILKQASASLSYQFTAKEGDSGKLVCKAEWGNVQKETYHAITVKELFSRPHLTVEHIPIFLGEHFKLTCSVKIYVPERINNDTMHFSIYKDNIKLTSEETYVAVADSHNNGNYTCKVETASVAGSFVKESQTIVVKAKVPVSKPKLSVVGGTLVLGKHFQLLCYSDNGTLPITYNLHGPDKKIQQRVVSKPGEHAIFNSSAIYKIADLNNFICHVTNSQQRAPMVATGDQMLRSTKIIEPVSIPVLTLQPSSNDISEGQGVTLVCSVQRGTLPISFTWYHTEGEGPLESKTPNTLEGAYRIISVRQKDQGGYYCVSTNPANETQQSPTVMIGVKMAGWKKGLLAIICILLILALILVVTFKRRLLRFKRKRTADLSVKSASTKTERLSLTQAEFNEAANVTPGMMGKSIWSEHVSGSESDDQNSVISPEKPEPQYTEVQTRQPDPNRAPVKKGTDTVYSEVRNSKQGVPEQADGQGSVEYAQLNHETDHHIVQEDHGDHDVQDDHTGNSVDSTTADHGE